MSRNDSLNYWRVGRRTGGLEITQEDVEKLDDVGRRTGGLESSFVHDIFEQ